MLLDCLTYLHKVFQYGKHLLNNQNQEMELSSGTKILLDLEFFSETKGVSPRPQIPLNFQNLMLKIETLGFTLRPKSKFYNTSKCIHSNNFVSFGIKEVEFGGQIGFRKSKDPTQLQSSNYCFEYEIRIRKHLVNHTHWLKFCLNLS